jgi:hypothetical protein
MSQEYTYHHRKLVWFAEKKKRDQNSLGSFNLDLYGNIILIDPYRTNSYKEWSFLGLAYQGQDIVFRFIIEYSSLWDFGP